MRQSFAFSLLSGIFAMAGFVASGAAAPQRSIGVSNAMATVTMRTKVKVSGDVVLLKDIAWVAADEPVSTRLLALNLGASPVDGQVRTITRDELKRWLVTSGYIANVAVHWEGGKSVRVERLASVVDDAALIRTGRKALRAELSRRFSDFSVEAAGEPLRVRLPAAHYRFRAGAIHVDGFVPKRLAVPVELWVGTQLYRSVPVAFNLTIYEPVLRASADLNPGDPLTGRLQTVRMDVTTLGDEYWPAARTLEGWRLRRRVLRGHALLASDLEPRPLIARGTVVALRVKAGSVLIESRARVLQDGWKDGLVRVKPTEGTDEIQARVISSDIVEAGVQ